MEGMKIVYPVSLAVLYFVGQGEDMSDTLDTVLTLTTTMKQMGHMVRTVEVTKRNWQKAVMVAGDVVINLVEDDDYSLYVKVAKRLEEIGRAQMGHDMKSLKYVVRKSNVKAALIKAGLATPAFRVFRKGTEVKNVRGLKFPVIVKPSSQHASVGISQDSIVANQEQLMARVKYLFAHVGSEVVAEEFIDGREMHVTVMGNGKLMTVLPMCEIVFDTKRSDGWNIYSYDAKWKKGTWEYQLAQVKCPAEMETGVEERIKRLVVKTCKVLGCKDIVRMDIRLDRHNKPYVIDVNMSPGIDKCEQEETWRSARALGLTYSEFVEKLIAVTYKRAYGKLPSRIRERSFLISGV
jgi:D-alanine-D-alanine ligase